MSKNAMTTEFLKECMADSLLKIMKEKEFNKITINEIADGAHVNRSTWFRNFNTKSDALTFKLIYQWHRFADERNIIIRNRYTLNNAKDFFEFNFCIKDILTRIYKADMQSTIYDAFYQIMMPQFGENAKECYENRFYSYGLFGLLDEWMKREFVESPEKITKLFIEIMSKNVK